MVEQLRIECGQVRAALEEDVGAVFGLVDDPVIALALEPGLAEQGVHRARPAVEDLDPAQPREAIGQGLRLGRVIELGEGVVMLHEADARVEELPGQPVVAVDVDLGGEREPSLHADVAEAEFRIQEVEVEDALGPAGEGEPGPTIAVAEFDRAAGLLAAEDADEALAETAFADLLLHEVFLAVASLKVDIRGTLPSSEVFGVGDEEFGFFLCEGQEIFTLDAESMIDEAIEVGFVGERQVSLEDYSILATKGGDDGGSELDDKRVRRLHGVLLRKGASATPF